MPLKTEEESATKSASNKKESQINERKFSQDYIDFLNDAGWRLEKKLPSNSDNYSDLLEDTDWTSNTIDFTLSKHYRRDLDALS